MRAVHRKDLKLLSSDPSHPAWDVARRSVPRPRKRIAIRRQPGLVLPIGVDGAERDPRLRRTLTAKTGKDIPEDRGRQQRRGNDIEPRAYEKQKATARDACRGCLARIVLLHGHDVFPSCDLVLRPAVLRTAIASLAGWNARYFVGVPRRETGGEFTPCSTSVPGGHWSSGVRMRRAPQDSGAALPATPRRQRCPVGSSAGPAHWRASPVSPCPACR